MYPFSETENRSKLPLSSLPKGRTPLILFLCTILTIATLSLFWRVGHHEFINLDDNVYITNNPHIRSGVTIASIRWAFTTVYEANWHPLTWLSHMADVQLYGLNPRGHHLTNVYLHTATSVVLFILLYRVTSAPWRSFFVAALFAIHPLHVESIAWAAERKDVLSGLFWFLTLYVYCEYVKTQQRSLYVLSLACFIAGLLAKPMAVTLPLILLFIDFWPLQRFSGYFRNIIVLEKIPFLACSAASSLITVYAQAAGGAVANTLELPLMIRIENALLAYCKYVGKLFCPTDLAVMYPFSHAIPPWQAFLSLAALLVFTWFCFVKRFRFPYLISGWAWFTITLIPVIGIIQVGSQSMADRYTYIPSVGLFIIAAWGLADVAAKNILRKTIVSLCAVSTLTAFASVTYHQIGYWQNNFTLYTHTLSVTNNNFFIHNLLGSAFQAADNSTSAIWHYRESVRIFPAFKNSHNNLGVMLLRSGKLIEARREFTEALQLDPNYSFARVNLALICLKEGDLVHAEQHSNSVLRTEPYNENARLVLGQVFQHRGNLTDAIREYREALRINPYYEKADLHLKEALAKSTSIAP